MKPGYKRDMYAAFNGLKIEPRVDFIPEPSQPFRTVARIIFRLRRTLTALTPLGATSAMYLAWDKWPSPYQEIALVVVPVTLFVVYHFDKRYSIPMEAELSLRDNPEFKRLERKIDILLNRTIKERSK